LVVSKVVKLVFWSVAVMVELTAERMVFHWAGQSVVDSVVMMVDLLGHQKVVW
jgi:hypothetical protein